MKLYFAPGTCALGPHIALQWVGADYEAVRVEIGSDDYRKINPTGAVPTLAEANGDTKTQAGAILQYIARRYPLADLGAGSDPAEQFLLDEQMTFLSSDFHPAFWPFFFPHRYTTATDEASLQAAKDASNVLVDKVMTRLDQRLADNNGHVVLGRRTIADPLAFAMSRWANYLPKKVAAYPNVHQFHERMRQDPGVQAAMAVHGLSA